MDRSQFTHSTADELRQIQADTARAESLEDLRRYFERIQTVRRTCVDDFDLQLLVAEVQQQVIDRGRFLQDEKQAGAFNGAPISSLAGIPARNGDTQTPVPSTPFARPVPPAPEPKAPPVSEVSEAAEIPPEVERLDAKTWQRATYLALFFAIILFAAFFYLVQTARRLNIGTSSSTAQQAMDGNKDANSATAPAPPPKPVLRLYTDLVGGTVTVDDKAPQDLKDGELVLENQDPGTHSVKVTGHSGDAAFSYDLSDKAAPRVIGMPSATNVMAVVVSTLDGKAHLVTNAENSDVMLDGKAAGQVGPDGLTLDNLGKTDHLLQVTQASDRQRFVLTYTAAPALTVYVKSDPNAGTVVITAGQDGADVYVDDVLLKRKTEQGQLRIPSLKVGEYTVRVHKDGFSDPPEQTVQVKKAEETELRFRLEPVGPVAVASTLDVRGALPGTGVYIDSALLATTGSDGNVTIATVKPGEHSIELRKDQAVPKRFDRNFAAGEVVALTGQDVLLQRSVPDVKAPASPVAPAQNTPPAAAIQNEGVQLDGEQVRKGGGFVPYHVPKVAGHYMFSAQSRKGGIFKHGKLQWYAGFQDSLDYVLFTLDGKHAIVREVREGKTTEINKVPFEQPEGQWVQVDLAVKPNSIDVRVKTPDGSWSDLGSVPSPGRDFTQDKVGFFIPGNDEVAIANFRFASH